VDTLASGMDGVGAPNSVKTSGSLRAAKRKTTFLQIEADALVAQQQLDVEQLMLTQKSETLRLQTALSRAAAEEALTESDGDSEILSQGGHEQVNAKVEHIASWAKM
jgi:hypothetical protein